MARLIDTRCRKCGEVYEDVWTDEDYPVCCGKPTQWTPTVLHTTEWGSPRHYPHLRDAPFSSRSELNSFAQKNGMALGVSSEKVGGARNEDHLNLGKRFSYSGSPKG